MHENIKIMSHELDDKWTFNNKFLTLERCMVPKKSLTVFDPIKIEITVKREKKSRLFISIVEPVLLGSKKKKKRLN